MKRTRTPRRMRPSCGHRRLVECPLTVQDWDAVWLAYLGFLTVCREVSERAHERAAEKAS